MCPVQYLCIRYTKPWPHSNNIVDLVTDLFMSSLSAGILLYLAALFFTPKCVFACNNKYRVLLNYSNKTHTSLIVLSNATMQQFTKFILHYAFSVHLIARHTSPNTKYQYSCVLLQKLTSSLLLPSGLCRYLQSVETIN